MGLIDADMETFSKSALNPKGIQTLRQRMQEFRRSEKMTISQMAKVCKCSEGLLRMVESGEVTHPNIAARIARAYMLDVDGYNELIPKEHRAKDIPKLRPSMKRPLDKRAARRNE